MLFGKYVNRFYKKYFWKFFFGIVFLLFVDVIQLIVPELIGSMTSKYDAGTLTQDDITRNALFIVLVGLGMFLGRFLWRVCILSSSFDITADLRDDMFSRSLSFSQRFYRNNKIGSIMSFYTSDIDTIQESFGWGLVMLVDALFLGTMTFIKMGMLNWQLTAICAIPLVILVVASYFLDKYIEKIYDERQTAFERLSDYAQEMFTGLRVIKAFVREAKEAIRFRKVNEENKKKDVRLVKFQAGLDMTFEILIQGMTCVGLFVGGMFVYNHLKGTSSIPFTRADMVTFIMYFDTIIWPMIALGSIVSLVSRAKASLKRITKYLDEPIDVKDGDVTPAPSIEGEIEFKDFHYAYDEKAGDVLKGLSFKINKGESIGVVGKIGSGKSTLAACLLRLDNVEPGTLYLDGRDIMSLPIKQVRGAIAYVPQDSFLFSSKIGDNIAFSEATLTEEQVIEAAEFADVHSNIVDFVEGYRTLIGERGVTLSGGQKQRISIARAYAKHAPIMILDDSVSAVDVRTEEKILKNIREKRTGQTTILIASRVSTVKDLDRILVLKEGQIEGFGTHEELLATSPTYAKMVRLQALEDSLK